LHATSLAPESGTPLVDRIDEESHRHAYGVSQDLKFSLREAIEILGNEAARLIAEKRREQQKGVFSGENALDAGILSTECLRYSQSLSVEIVTCSRSVDRIGAAVICAANAVHMTAPAEDHHAKKLLQQGNHPHMTAEGIRWRVRHILVRRRLAGGVLMVLLATGFFSRVAVSGSLRRSTCRGPASGS
jgi:hypothetical protein